MTSLNKFAGPKNVEVAGQPVQGRSGGGLFDCEGYVVGVCNAADPADNEGLFAAVETLHKELDQAHLSVVYQSSPPGAARAVPTAIAAAALAIPTGRPAGDQAAVPIARWPAASRPMNFARPRPCRNCRLPSRVRRSVQIKAGRASRPRSSASSVRWAIQKPSPKCLCSIAARETFLDNSWPPSVARKALVG